MNSVPQWIYILGMVFLNIMFLLEWLRLRGKIRIYSKYGILAGFGVVCLNVIYMVLALSSSASMVFVCGLAALAITYLRIYGFTMLGMFYSEELGYPSFPLLIRRYGFGGGREWERPDPPSEKTDPENAGGKPANPLKTGRAEKAVAPADGASSDDISECVPAPEKTDWRKYFTDVLAVVLAGTLYSIVLFLLVRPQMTETVRNYLDPIAVGDAGTTTITGVLALLLFAVAEELIFRLGVQNFLARYLRLKNGWYWAAIVLTSVLWTSGHAGALTPEWVKLAQVFPLGLLLGWLYTKRGVEGCILAHGLINLILLLPADYLIK